MLNVGDYVTIDSQPKYSRHAACPEVHPRVAAPAKVETPLFDESPADS